MLGQCLGICASSASLNHYGTNKLIRSFVLIRTGYWLEAFRAFMAGKSRGSALLALAFHVAKRRRWADAGDQVDAVKCEAARLRMPYDTATVADAVAIVRASKVRQGCHG